MNYNRIIILIIIALLCVMLFIACEYVNNANPSEGLRPPPEGGGEVVQTTYTVDETQWNQAFNINNKIYDGCIANVVIDKGSINQKTGVIRKKNEVYSETWVDKQNNDTKTITIYDGEYAYNYLQRTDEYYVSKSNGFVLPEWWDSIRNLYQDFSFDEIEHKYSFSNSDDDSIGLYGDISIWIENKSIMKMICIFEEGTITIEMTYNNPYPISLPTEFKSSEDFTLSVNFIDGQQEIAVTGVVDKSVLELTIPNYVSIIAPNALRDLYNLEVVNMSSNIKYIGEYAFFDDRKLKTIILPEGLTSIEDSTFFGCSELENINIPSSVTRIGKNAFNSTSINNIHINENIQDIGDYAFANNKYVEAIIVDSNNTKYDSRDNCNAIIETTTNKLIRGCKNTIIPNTIIQIGDSAFSFCQVGNSINIPDSVKSIGESAFYKCGLANVTIPNSVEKIERFAFGGNQLHSISIHEYVSEIGDRAFDANPLETIIVDANNEKYDSRNGCNALIETATNTLLCGSINTIIPNDIITIKEYAFCGLGITSISIPDSVKTIEFGAFMDCQELESVTLGSGLEQIDGFAFAYTKITKALFGANIKTIEWGAFAYCKELTEIELPSGLETIGDVSFGACLKLETITYHGSVDEWSQIEIGRQSFGGIKTDKVVCLDGDCELE